ncbi:MAG: hypothetical protein GX654_17930 [Desulfatiglans sp.]|nr:hypothetical protein [Desulfatiglans sp.]
MILAANLIWFVFGGGFFAWIGCFLSFILIFSVFFGIAHFKLVKVCFSPLGKRAVSIL